ncbi:MAG: hypothetical protein KatS3mg128_0428 [Silanimonas sp.]|nr:MAG: hypothetical protein KatS3mg128_0428 [Silanimonas sp.]
MKKRYKDDLLSELARLDQQRSQLLQRQGRMVLEALASSLDAGAAGGHSRTRHLLVGSTTTTLLRQSPVPVLLLC